MTSRRDSLALGAPPAEVDTLHARSASGAVTAHPEPGRVVCFGRAPRAGSPGPGLGVGVDDLRVSRRHGELTYRTGRWWLRNTGRQALRLPYDELLHPGGDPVPLAPGYTPLFVRGSVHREHLLELYVTDAAPLRAHGGPMGALSDEERLLLAVLGQRYLRHESAPRPLHRAKALQQLWFLRPGTDWESPGVRQRITAIGLRLAPGDGAGRPLPLDRLLMELVASATLVPPDLDLLDSPLAD